MKRAGEVDDMTEHARRALPRAGRLVGAAVIAAGMGGLMLVGCGQSAIPGPTATPLLPDISQVEPVVETGPTPVVLSLVYQDDFSDQSSGWDDAFDEHTLKQYGATKYHIEVDAPNLFAWGVANRDIADFVLEVVTKQWEGPDNNSYGVIFRVQDKDNFYRFDITGDGFFLLSKYVNANWLTLADWSQSPAINTGPSENRLRVSALNSRISVYVNGQFLAEVTDESFRRGDIGFFAGTFNEPGVHVSFDDLQIWAPPGSEIVLRATATPLPAAGPALAPVPAETLATTGSPSTAQPAATAGRIVLGQPTATSGRLAAGSPTVTPPAENITGTPAATPAPPVAATVWTSAALENESTLVPETLPGYVSAVQPKPKDAAEVSGTIAYPVFDVGRGTYDIFSADVATGESKRIQEDASQPALSPDGLQIAFRSWDPLTRGLLHRSLNSKNIEMIVKRDEAAHPIWSADGQTFFFHSREESDRTPRLYRAAGGIVETLKDAGDALRGESPSRLGENELVYKGCVGNNCGLMRVAVSGGAPQQLTGDLSDTAPAGSPDGERIAFMSRRSGSWDIYTISSDGANLTDLTSDASNEGLPAWSPDGRSIAFLSDRNGTWGLWVMESDGSNQYQLLQLSGPPDGKVGSAQAFTSLGWLEEQISWVP